MGPKSNSLFALTGDRIFLIRRTGSPMSNARSTRGERSTVLVIDDDMSVLKALARLIRSAGYDVRTFSRPSALLADDLPTTNACMIADVNLPEMNGAELCEALARSGRGLPVIFITGRTDATTKALTERVSAIAVLFKPFNDSLLLPAISRALETQSR
jgi:FixJ family two-component response regulator